jgi:hypothetical protein
MMPKERIVSKVGEFMETLDHVKRYNALARSLKEFAAVIAGSFVIFLVLRGLVDFLDLSSVLDRPIFLLTLFLLLLIPLFGIVAGIMVARKRVNSVRAGKWKEELSQGFPSTLKMLLELDWDKTIDDISGRLSYFVYGLLKTVAYWFVTFFWLGASPTTHQIEVKGFII